MKDSKNTTFRENINKLLSRSLSIPNYQRPYKWNKKNIIELLSDIENAINNKDNFGSEFRYRIGTIILHKEKNSTKYDIVDGQQRIISLTLIKKCIKPDFRCEFFNDDIDNLITQKNIHDNYVFIKGWLSQRPELIPKIDKAFQDTLEVIIICVNNISEAFQLFDSQNNRGKPLDPHDLLKAYHLREMKNEPYEMRHAVTKWEAKDTETIKTMFEKYLFPIWNWSRRSKSIPFTDKEIDTYKGINGKSYYPYAKRASRTMPYFQITETFISGNDFFEYVDHYMNMLEDINNEIRNNFEDIYNLIDKDPKKNKYYTNRGFKYATELFLAALLCYYDRFHNFNPIAVRKLFVWAMMLRIDMQNLGLDTINKYAVGGEDNERYTVKEAMFSRICFARTHSEIVNMDISISKSSGKAVADKWNNLYGELKKIIAGRGI